MGMYCIGYGGLCGGLGICCHGLVFFCPALQVVFHGLGPIALTVDLFRSLQPGFPWRVQGFLSLVQVCPSSVRDGAGLGRYGMEIRIFNQTLDLDGRV